MSSPGYDKKETTAVAPASNDVIKRHDSGVVDGDQARRENQAREGRRPSFKPSLPELTEGSSMELLGKHMEVWAGAEVIEEKRQRVEETDIPDYRPGVLRRPFLIGVIMLVLLFMALSELTVHLLPNDYTPPILRSRTDEHGRNVQKEYRLVPSPQRQEGRTKHRRELPVLTIVEITTIITEPVLRRDALLGGNAPQAANLATAGE